VNFPVPGFASFIHLKERYVASANNNNNNNNNNNVNNKKKENHTALSGCKTTLNSFTVKNDEKWDVELRHLSDLVELSCFGLQSRKNVH